MRPLSLVARDALSALLDGRVRYASEIAADYTLLRRLAAKGLCTYWPAPRVGRHTNGSSKVQITEKGRLVLQTYLPSGPSEERRGKGDKGVRRQKRAAPKATLRNSDGRRS